MPARLVPSHGILASRVSLMARCHIHARHAVVLTADSILVQKDNEKSTAIPSYLDMPMVNSITSVYQAKRLKDAMQFHHASFNNCSKSTILAAASKGILPTWPLLTRANISKYVSETQATHMGHMQRICQNLRSTKKELPIYLQNLDTEGINVEREETLGEVYILVLAS